MILYVLPVQMGNTLMLVTSILSAQLQPVLLHVELVQAQIQLVLLAFKAITSVLAPVLSTLTTMIRAVDCRNPQLLSFPQLSPSVFWVCLLILSDRRHYRLLLTKEQEIEDSWGC